jgi:hypothetical protein
MKVPAVVEIREAVGNGSPAQLLFHLLSSSQVMKPT